MVTPDFEACSLFFLAHPDDELGILPRLVEEVHRGIRPICLFLTSGAIDTATTGRSLVRVRKDESRMVLLSHGCRQEDIHFPGADIFIDDGSLFLHLAAANQASTDILARIPRECIRNIYCPAWEGGHHDHDATHLIALAQALRLGALTRTCQFPLYNGRGLPGMLFRPQSPIAENGDVVRFGVPRFRALGYWLLARHYRSQWRTWMGLLLPALVKTAWSPGIALQPVSVGRVTQRPHPGALYYERRYGVSYEHFSAMAGPFIQSRIHGMNRD
jgi:LmbE family N-acetylglucosaminyl deacetylase